MRPLFVALTVASTLCAASAQAAQGDIVGPDIRERLQPHTVPSEAPKQAEDAVRRYFGDPDGAQFRDVRANEVAAVRRSPFEDRVDGPVSVVCGEFNVPGRIGGYSWFFVAIKSGCVLWTAADSDHARPGEAYYSCKGAGLTNDGPPFTLPDD